MKIKLSATNIEEATSVVAAQRGIENFTKVVELGNDYRLIIPVDPSSIIRKKPAIMSAAFPVRKLDRFVKGSTYILEDWESDPMTGRYIDKTPLQPFRAISNVIHKAECVKAKRKKEQELELDAKDQEIDINSPEFIAKKAVELHKIDVEYNGDDTVSPKQYASKKPLVGGISTYICTELYVIPVKDDVPNFDNAKIASYDISSGVKLTKLKTAFAKAYKEGDKYVELHIQYGKGCTKKQEAGQALVFEAVAEKDRLSVVAEEKWKEFESKLDDLAKSAEQIAARSLAATYNQTADALIASLKDYLSKIPGLFKFVDYEDNGTKYAAKSILESGLKLDDVTVEKLNKLVEEAGETIEDAEPVEGFNQGAVAATTNLDDLEEAVVASSETGDLSALDTEDFDFGN